MPVALIAMAVFIAVIIVWVVVVKRNMGEGMMLGFLAAALFSGTDAPGLILRSFIEAAQKEVMYAATAFVFMSYFIERIGIIQKLVDILSGALGRLKGGPALVDTVISGSMGALAGGSNTGNAAASGSITGPWMMKSGWSKNRAATVIAGNAGLGAALPPSASMVIMIGFATAYVTTSNVYVALLAAGLYQVLIRLVLVYWFVHRDRIQPTPRTELPPLKESWNRGWKSTFIVFGAVVPILVSVGPLADFLSQENVIGGAHEDISLITWIPVLMMLLGALVTWRSLPRSPKGWWDIVQGSLPRFYTIIAILFFAVAASTVLEHLGLSSDVESLLAAVDIPVWLLVAIVGAFIVVVAGPLTSAATVTAVGQMSLFTLVSAGVDPLLAVTAILVFASTEGASAPASGSIFVASGLTGAKPEKMFVPLLIYYVFPFYVLGVLIALGLLPMPF